MRGAGSKGEVTGRGGLLILTRTTATATGATQHFDYLGRYLPSLTSKCQIRIGEGVKESSNVPVGKSDMNCLS